MPCGCHGRDRAYGALLQLRGHGPLLLGEANQAINITPATR
jgi:hypothetical protein